MFSFFSNSDFFSLLRLLWSMQCLLQHHSNEAFKTNCFILLLCCLKWIVCLFVFFVPLLLCYCCCFGILWSTFHLKFSPQRKVVTFHKQMTMHDPRSLTQTKHSRTNRTPTELHQINRSFRWRSIVCHIKCPRAIKTQQTILSFYHILIHSQRESY